MLFCSLVYKNMGGFLQQKAYSQLRAHSLFVFVLFLILFFLKQGLVCNDPSSALERLHWIKIQRIPYLMQPEAPKRGHPMTEGVQSSVAWAANFHRAGRCSGGEEGTVWWPGDRQQSGTGASLCLQQSLRGPDLSGCVTRPENQKEQRKRVIFLPYSHITLITRKYFYIFWNLLEILPRVGAAVEVQPQNDPVTKQCCSFKETVWFIYSE